MTLGLQGAWQSDQLILSEWDGPTMCLISVKCFQYGIGYSWELTYSRVVFLTGPAQKNSKYGTGPTQQWNKLASLEATLVWNSAHPLIVRGEV